MQVLVSCKYNMTVIFPKIHNCVVAWQTIPRGRPILKINPITWDKYEYDHYGWRLSSTANVVYLEETQAQGYFRTGLQKLSWVFFSFIRLMWSHKQRQIVKNCKYTKKYYRRAAAANVRPDLAWLKGHPGSGFRWCHRTPEPERICIQGLFLHVPSHCKTLKSWRRLAW